MAAWQEISSGRQGTFFYSKTQVKRTRGAVQIVLNSKTLSPVLALWERKRPLMMARLTVLDRAAEAAASGHLAESLCEEALGEAHKLAGSLGTFGFPEGTEIARQLELGFEDGTLEPERMRKLTRQLRETLFPTSIAS